jgi:hypothetical protein
MAAVIGAVSPDVQESTIAARYVEEGDPGHNADEYTIKVSDVDKTIQALSDLSIANFSVNETTKELTLLNIFAFPTDIDNIIDNLALITMESNTQHQQSQPSSQSTSTTSGGKKLSQIFREMPYTSKVGKGFVMSSSVQVSATKPSSGQSKAE